MSLSDAFWMSAKRNGKCAECKDEILEGDRIVYHPSTHSAYCKSNGCGEEIAGEDPEEVKKEADEIRRQRHVGLRKQNLENKKVNRKGSK